jgi:hypothetical protein
MNLIFCGTHISNICLRTRSALSCINAVSGLLANYLFTQFQKVK